MPDTPTPNVIDVDTAVRLVTASAWPAPETRADCPRCGGSGKDPESAPRLILHTRRGGFGADNDLDGLLEELRAADRIVWRNTIIGPVVFADGPRGQVSIDVHDSPPS